MKKKKTEEQQREYIENWMVRIKGKEQFSYNDRSKCRAQCGFDPVEMRKQLQDAQAEQKRIANASAFEKISLELQRTERSIETAENDLKDELSLPDSDPELVKHYNETIKFNKDKLVRLQKEQLELLQPVNVEQGE